MDGVRITKVALTDDGKATARVNGLDVKMLSPLGGWLFVKARRELCSLEVARALNKKVRSLRRGEEVTA